MPDESERERERERRRRKQREKEKERERIERGGGENAFAYEIKWRIYTVRPQYTYIRPTVNYTVNRRVLFDRRGKEDRAPVPRRGRRTRKRERERAGYVRRRKGRKEVEKGGRQDTTTAKFMEREMIYGTIVENKSHGSKDV